MNKTKKMTQMAVIAALYAAITFAVFYMSFGMVQYRISEALTVLPAFTPVAAGGLTLGCAIANLVGFFIGVNPLGWLDAIIGTLATLLAAISTRQISKSKKRWVRYAFCPLPAVIFNAVFVGFELTLLSGSFNPIVFLTNAGLVGLGELVVCYALGLPLMVVLERNELYKKIFN